MIAEQRIGFKVNNVILKLYLTSKIFIHIIIRFIYICVFTI
jgi:hypothetical protein